MTSYSFTPKPTYAATFSIAAADPSTGQVGVAVQSKYFAVGAVVPWARAGVGAVATQAMVVARYGPDLLGALEAGQDPQSALDAALAIDDQAGLRQIGIVRADGESASHTGAECLSWAGGRVGPGYAVQGNILAGEQVVEDMVAAFTANTGSLAEGLLAALEAGQAAGGDSRGQQSAALYVEQAGYGETSQEGIDRLIDIRVDDHTAPISELRRLYELWQEQDMLKRGMALYGKKEYPAAAQLMLEASQQFPKNAGILYNLACFESLSGLSSEAIIHLGQSIALDASFHEFAKSDTDLDALREMPEFKALLSAG